MKTISESILSKTGTGLDIKLDEWFAGLAKSQKEVTRCEDMPKINYVGKLLTIDKKFSDEYPSFVMFNTATDVVFDFPDLKTAEQWPRRVLGSLSIYRWPSGSLSNMPALSDSSEIIVSECNLLTSLKGLDSVWSADSLTIESCGKLSSLTGIPRNIKNVTIKDCPKLVDLSELKNLHLDSLVISDCPGITTLKGCPDTINGNFAITRNLNLTNLDGMPKVVKGTITVYGNGMNFRPDDISARCKAHRIRLV